MLGEMIGEERGKLTTRRVLPGEGQGGPKMEVSFKASGKVLGVDAVNTGTYVAVMGPGGILTGEGQGIAMTKEGEGIAWKGSGIGKFTSKGGVTWRGAIYYQTASQKLARLNGLVGVFEHETDAEDNVVSKIWEWK